MSQKCKLYPQDLITVFESHSKMSHVWSVSNTVPCQICVQKSELKKFYHQSVKTKISFCFFFASSSLLGVICWCWPIFVLRYGTWLFFDREKLLTIDIMFVCICRCCARYFSSGKNARSYWVRLKRTEEKTSNTKWRTNTVFAVCQPAI